MLENQHARQDPCQQQEPRSHLSNKSPSEATHHAMRATCARSVVSPLSDTELNVGHCLSACARSALPNRGISVTCRHGARGVRPPLQPPRPQWIRSLSITAPIGEETAVPRRCPRHHACLKRRAHTATYGSSDTVPSSRHGGASGRPLGPFGKPLTGTCPTCCDIGPKT